MWSLNRNLYKKYVKELNEKKKKQRRGRALQLYSQFKTPYQKWGQPVKAPFIHTLMAHKLLPEGLGPKCSC